MKLLPLALVLLTGCASLIPDWNTRSMGMHQTHEPEYMFWTAPLYKGYTKKNECIVTVYTMVKHRGPATMSIQRLLDFQFSEPEISWKTEWRVPIGRSRFKAWFLDGEETAAYRETQIECVALMGSTIEPMPYEG